MKKVIIKAFCLAAITLSFFSCKNDDLKYDAQENMGWVQFVESQYGGQSTYRTTQVKQEVIRIPVNIQVPETSSDLTISYDITPVSGMNPSGIFNSSSITVAAGHTTYASPDNNTGINYVNAPTINFDVANIPTDLTEPMIFDVTLSGTSSSSISVGLPSESFPVTTRVEICPSLFDSSTGNYLGDYTLTVPTGPSAFGVPIFDDNQVVTLVEGANGSLSREFDVVYLPAFVPFIQTVSFQFANGDVMINDTDTGLSCDVTNIVLSGDASSIVYPCTEDQIVLNMIDFTGGSGDCGPADVPFTVILTKI